MRIFLRMKPNDFLAFVKIWSMYGSEAWCLLRRTERSIVGAMCGIQLIDMTRVKDLMLMLGLNETIDQLAMANSVRCYGHVLRREDGHVLRRALDFEVEGQRKMVKPRRTWKKKVCWRQYDCC